MAKLQGIELVNVKYVQGRADVGFGADVKLNGKKIGSLTDYADGSCEINEFIQPEYETALKEAISTFDKNEEINNPYYKKTKELHKENAFYEYLIELTNHEKEFKKVAKKGKNYLVLMNLPTDFFDEHYGQSYSFECGKEFDVEGFTKTFDKPFTDIFLFNSPEQFKKTY